MSIMLLVAGLTLGAVEDGPVDRSLFTTITEIFEISTADDGSPMMKAESGPDSFVFPTQEPAARQRITKLLDDAKAHAKTVTVKFNADQGILGPYGLSITYPACSVALDDAVITIGDGCSDPGFDAAAARQRPLEAINIANAYMSEGHSKQAEALLFPIDADALPTKEAQIMLAMLVNTLYANRGYQLERATPEADREYFAAFQAAERLAQLRPEIPAPLILMGNALHELGAYDDAIANYRMAGERHPWFKWFAQIAEANTLRQRGQPEEALALLNKLYAYGEKEALEPNFYTERGQILLDLDRPDEAITAFNETIRNQPGNAFALRRRACAYATIGQLVKARHDLEQSRQLTLDYSQFNRTEREEEKIDRITQSIARISAALDQGSNAAMPELCEGYFRENEDAREPSSLLAKLENN